MSKRPNILIFMTDQQRGDVTRADHPCRTPVLDRFRQDAVEFTEAFCPSPHCCPSRATFFTGLYPTEHGVWNNVAVQNTLSRGLKSGTRLWSQDLVDAGYTCDFAGKWHVSFDQAPRDFGWQERRVTAPPEKDGAGVMGSDWDGYRAMAAAGEPTSERGTGEIRRPGWPAYTHFGINEDPFNDSAVVASACEALRAKAESDDPWCLYCGPLGPHDPYVVPQRFLDMYADVDIPLPASFHDAMRDKPALYQRTRGFFDQLTPEEHREAIRHYWAFCTYEDWLFGQVLETLEATGQAEDTLVLFCSDHGDYAGEHGLWCKGLPCFRGAYHVPALMRWPGGVRTPGRTVDACIGLEDFGPTFLEAAGIAGAPMSGRSLMPFLQDEEPQDWRDTVCTQSNGNEQYGIQRSATTREWRYVYNGFDFDELYDLRNDPHEVHNIADDPRYAAIKRQMCSRLWQFARDHDDGCINGYIMVGMAPYGPAYAFRED